MTELSKHYAMIVVLEAVSMDDAWEKMGTAIKSAGGSVQMLGVPWRVLPMLVDGRPEFDTMACFHQHPQR
jgi:hypothetical protein